MQFGLQHYLGEQSRPAIRAVKADDRGMSDHSHHSLDELHLSLLSGKLPRSLRWNHAVELIERLGSVEARGDNEFVFAVGSQRLTFKKPSDHELGVEEVSRLRKFLRDAGPETATVKPIQPRRVIVVIDHHAAHIYREDGGSVPVSEETVRPYDPYGFRHHLLHRKEAHYRGEHVPEENSFYEDVAKDIKDAVEIVIVGHGTGKSDAAAYLVSYLKTHHADLAKRVVATENVDLSAATPAEIEALAKKHMIAVVA